MSVYDEEPVILEPKYLLMIENKKILFADTKSPFNKDFSHPEDFIMIDKVRKEHISIDKIALGTLKARPTNALLEPYVIKPISKPQSNFLFPWAGKYYSVFLEEYDELPFWAKLVDPFCEAFRWCYEGAGDANVILSIHCSLVGRTIPNKRDDDLNRKESLKKQEREKIAYNDLRKLYGLDDEDEIIEVKKEDPKAGATIYGKPKELTDLYIKPKGLQTPFKIMGKERSDVEIMREAILEERVERTLNLLDKTQKLSLTDDYISIINLSAQQKKISFPKIEFNWHPLGFECVAFFVTERKIFSGRGNTKMEAKQNACESACEGLNLI